MTRLLILILFFSLQVYSEESSDFKKNIEMKRVSEVMLMQEAKRQRGKNAPFIAEFYCAPKNKNDIVCKYTGMKFLRKGFHVNKKKLNKVKE